VSKGALAAVATLVVIVLMVVIAAMGSGGEAEPTTTAAAPAETTPSGASQTAATATPPAPTTTIDAFQAAAAAAVAQRATAEREAAERAAAEQQRIAANERANAEYWRSRAEAEQLENDRRAREAAVERERLLEQQRAEAIARESARGSGTVPAPAPSMQRITASSFSFLYPMTWQAAPNQPADQVHVFMPGAVRKQPDGTSWFDYSVLAFVAPWERLPRGLREATTVVARNYINGNPGMRLTGQSTPEASPAGQVMWTELQLPSRYGYTEINRMLTVERPNGLAVMVFAAPSGEFAQLEPIFTQIVSSLAFR
jgi:hypothetical protein